jgi:hypothetical protein
MNTALLAAVKSNPELDRLAYLLVTQHQYVAALLMGCIVSAALKRWLQH